ncbi:hypothetical protein [Aliiglaciecola sp. LCG003]|uniref:hypothetical protein n=1 Tax=Aliiglaciecola sp. LCG003 TaxID=3053655 RepID=UPI0025744FAE|nr:hypothetical protein [Aliiglaciecola sp. LCG003]WJG09497.1 hypothetical protein QR722_00230 [Aliiglaciecola sp. LCG003]
MLIYFVVRHQSAQSELNKLTHQVKSLDKQSRFSLQALSMLAGQMQKTYQIRLDNLNKHALISSADFKIVSFIIAEVEFVIMQCCEKSATVEEALLKALENSELDMEQIKKYIANQPAEIRVPWCKNTVGGFVSACHNLTSDRVKQADPRELEKS